MSGHADQRSELFARALDRGTPASSVDAELRRDLALVGQLAQAGQALGPTAVERGRMRERLLAQLSAEAPVAQAPVTAAPPPDPGPVEQRAAHRVVVPIRRATRRRAVAAGVQGRLLVAAAAAMCLLITLSGMSLVLARDALPGDALYRFKRSAESAELGLTFGDEPRGFKHLQFATARVDEIEALTALGSTGDPGRFIPGLQSFDADAAAGSRLLIDAATNAGGDELSALRAWAEQQRIRLRAASAQLPARAAARTDGSAALLDRIAQRADALQLRIPCLAVTSGTRDDIGLLPSQASCVPVAPGPGGAGTGQAPANRPTGERPVPSMVVSPQTGEQSADPLAPFEPGWSDPGWSDPEQPTGPPSTTTPGPGQPDPGSTITVPLPLPLPEISLPPLLSGLLPGLKIG